MAITDRARREAENKLAVRNETKAHGKQKPLRFRPAARLQYLLSEQLVSDPNVAILEFVKNAYDADATDVLIEFDLHDDLTRASLIIADNGEGMDADSFEQNWMHPGYSDKIDAGPTSRSRVPVGEKGLGRLAAGRLGATLDVYSRRRKKDPWFHAFFRWEDFNEKDKLLDEIPITWDLVSEPPVDNLNSGTVIHIKSLSLKWDRRPPGRRGKKRAVTSIGRLRQDLEVLLMPLTAGGQDFDIRLRHNSTLPEDKVGYIGDEEQELGIDLGEPEEAEEPDEDAGLVIPPDVELLDYEYKFDLKRHGRGWRVTRTVKRSPEVVELTGSESETVTTVAGSELGEALDLEACGPVSGTFYYAPESARAFRDLRVPTGIRIYRDSVRVDPYGDEGDDWLLANERKAVRQGHAPIQPNALYGAVIVSREHNPNLRLLANREGFIANPAQQAFFALARNEFFQFSRLIEEELLKPRWDKQQAAKRSDRAFSSQQWAVAMTRATAHAVRQPVASAGAELRSLRKTIDKIPDVPKDLREELCELHEHTKIHLGRIDEAIAKMLGFLDVDPEPRLIDLVDLVADVVKNVRPDAKSARVALHDDNYEDHEVYVVAPAGLIEHALEELLENAIQAPRPEGRKGWVRVRVVENKEVRIEVSDNAGGIDKKLREALFKQTVSNTGRIGLGLLFNRQLLQIAGGNIELTDTSTEGSVFSIILPPA